MTSKEALDLLYSDAINGNMDENHEYINREEIEREYFEIKHDLDRLEKLEEAHKNLWDIAYNRYYKVIKILKDKLDIKLEVYRNGGCILNHKVIYNCMIPNERCLRYLEVEEYKLLKEILENE